ncbi:hypothetical protein [Microbacterium aurum]
MDDTNLNEENDTTRPLGYWLRAVDGLLTRAFAEALAAEGVDRRDWMLLNAVSGDIDAPGLTERLARKGKRLRSFEDRGWALEKGDGTWELTDLGRAEKERLGAIVDGIRTRVTGAVGDEGYAQLTASLEAIARELGWDETAAAERGFGRPRFGRGFGPGFAGPGFGRAPFGAGFGPHRHGGFGPGRPGRPADHDGEPMHGRSECGERHGHPHAGPGRHGHPHEGGHDHPRHGHHRRGHGGRRAQEAYERGFDAGFAHGREDRAA